MPGSVFVGGLRWSYIIGGGQHHYCCDAKRGRGGGRWDELYWSLRRGSVITAAATWYRWNRVYKSDGMKDKQYTGRNNFPAGGVFSDLQQTAACAMSRGVCYKRVPPFLQRQMWNVADDEVRVKNRFRAWLQIVNFILARGLWTPRPCSLNGG